MAALRDVVHFHDAPALEQRDAPAREQRDAPAQGRHDARARGRHGAPAPRAPARCGAVPVRSRYAPVRCVPVQRSARRHARPGSSVARSAAHHRCGRSAFRQARAGPGALRRRGRCGVPARIHRGGRRSVRQDVRRAGADRAGHRNPVRDRSAARVRRDPRRGPVQPRGGAPVLHPRQAATVADPLRVRRRLRPRAVRPHAAFARAQRGVAPPRAASSPACARPVRSARGPPSHG